MSGTRQRGARWSLARETRALRTKWRRPGAHPEGFHPTYVGVLALLILACVAGIAYLSDVPAQAHAQTLSPAVIRFFQIVTQFGDSAYVLVPSGIIAIACGLARGRVDGPQTDRAVIVSGQRALYVFAAVAVAGIFTQIAKHILSRPRPPLFDTYGAFHFEWFMLKSAYASFPSGHSATAFAAAVALGFFLPRARWWLLAVALLVAMSRVALRAHYVSDVVAGAALGAAAAVLVARVFSRRRIAFFVTKGQVVPRGRGLLLPALRQWIRKPA